MSEQLNTLLEDACRAVGVEICRLSDGWTHVLQRDRKTRLVVGHVFDINTAAAAELCNDKVALSTYLDFRSIDNIPHRLVTVYVEAADSSWERRNHQDRVAVDALDELLELGITPPMVIKPVRGTGGMHVVLADDRHEATRLLIEQLRRDGMAAVSPYVPIEREFRLVVLDDDVVCALTKERSEDWRHNLSYGARATELADVPDGARGVACEATAAIGMRLASIDCVEVAGRWSVLEINKGTKLVAWSRQSPAERDRVVEIYAQIIDALF